MAGFAKNPEDARALRALRAIRNNNLAAASVAGYGSYVVVGTVAAPFIGTGAHLEVAGLTAGTVGKAAVTSAGIGGGWT